MAREASLNPPSEARRVQTHPHSHTHTHTHTHIHITRMEDSGTSDKRGNGFSAPTLALALLQLASLWRKEKSKEQRMKQRLAIQNAKGEVEGGLSSLSRLIGGGERAHIPSHRSIRNEQRTFHRFRGYNDPILFFLDRGPTGSPAGDDHRRGGQVNVIPGKGRELFDPS
jgi:hypothetical protein